MNTAIEQPYIHSSEHHLQDNEEPLEHYFSVENELQRARNQHALGYPEQQTKELLAINLRTTLEEFAGKVSNSKIQYLWDNEQLRAPGVVEPAVEMYRRWAETSDGSREQADYVGIRKVEEGIRAGANVAFLVSPPSFGERGFGTYGFLNVFVRTPDGIDMHSVKYEHEDAAFSQSNGIYRGILSELSEGEIEHEQKDTVQGFLSEPLILASQDPNQAITSILTRLGFSQAVINLEEHPFTTAIRTELATWMQEFPDLVIAASKATDPDARSFLTEEANKRLLGCYNKAKKIKERLDRSSQAQRSIKHSSVDAYINSPSTTPLFDSSYEELMYYSTLPALVEDGGSCPSGKAKKNGHLNKNEILQTTGGVVTFELEDLLTSPEKPWKYENEGVCKGCGKSHEVVGKLGPCMICKDCEKAEDAKAELVEDVF